MHPSGVVNRLEYLVDVANDRVKDEVKVLAPSADENQIQNLQNLIETSRGLNLLYRNVRHHYLAGKKGRNLV